MVLLTLLPLLAVGWLSARLHNNEAVVVEAQLRKLIDTQLGQIDFQISDYFLELEQQLLQKADQLSLGANRAGTTTDRLRKLVRETPVIHQVFVLNSDGDRLFPPVANASTKEQAFVQKTQELWEDMNVFSVTEDIFPEAPVAALAPETEVSSFTLGQTSKTVTGKLPAPSADLSVLQPEPLESEDSVVSNRRGWTVWYSGRNRELIFWFWDGQNNLVGIQLTTAYLTADLISRLPDNRSADKLLGNARIQLLNTAQEIVYQWGSYDIGEAEPALSLRMLSHPLDGWQLAYFAVAANASRSLQWLLYVAALGLLGLILLLLAWIIYREYQRQTTIAQQRVTFVNQVSHELKTPLTNICLYADLLKAEVDDEDSPPVVNKYLQVIGSESQRLARLINNVLSFSRTQKQSLNLQSRAGVVDQTVHGVAQVFEPLLANRGVSVDSQLKAGETVLFDAELLEQVLNNLLGNVEKYATDADLVRLETSQHDGKTTVIVQDNGPGIDPSLAEKVFEPFYRVSSKLTDGVAGTGIGLSIARELCRLHGGDLTLEKSEQGARFVVQLATPVAQEAG